MRQFLRVDKILYIKYILNMDIIKNDYLSNLRCFLSNIIERQNMIKKVSMAKMEWADDNLLHTINEDIMDYLLYLSTDELFVGKLLQPEINFLESVIRVFYDYDKDEEFIEYCSMPKELHLDIIIRCYNKWFEDSEEARKIKFPLSFQERIDTIPASMQQLRCYDQCFYEKNKMLITVDFFNIYKEIGYNYLNETGNVADIKLEKYNSFLNHIDNLTFSGVKLSSVINQ